MWNQHASPASERPSLKCAAMSSRWSSEVRLPKQIVYETRCMRPSPSTVKSSTGTSSTHPDDHPAYCCLCDRPNYNGTSLCDGCTELLRED